VEGDCGGGYLGCEEVLEEGVELVLGRGLCHGGSWMVNTRWCVGFRLLGGRGHTVSRGSRAIREAPKSEWANEDRVMAFSHLLILPILILSVI
jgi:hypothetical protein